MWGTVEYYCFRLFQKPNSIKKKKNQRMWDSSKFKNALTFVCIILFQNVRIGYRNEETTQWGNHV